MDASAGPSAQPGTPPAYSLTPITEGAKPGGGKKRQRPQSTTGAAAALTPSAEQGMRSWALQVCNIVQSKRETTYMEVADTLVDELTGPDKSSDPEHDARNIRRCVPARH